MTAMTCHFMAVLYRKVKQSPTMWPGLLVCIMETLVPEDASRTKEEIEVHDNDEVQEAVLFSAGWIYDLDLRVPTVLRKREGGRLGGWVGGWVGVRQVVFARNDIL